MMGAWHDLKTGAVIGTREVLKEVLPDKHGHRRFQCRCDVCGHQQIYRMDWLLGATDRLCKICNAREASRHSRRVRYKEKPYHDQLV